MSRPARAREVEAIVQTRANIVHALSAAAPSVSRVTCHPIDLPVVEPALSAVQRHLLLFTSDALTPGHLDVS